MTLAAAALVWIFALLAISFAPQLDDPVRRERQLDLIAVGALGLATLGFFWRLIFSANVWMPAGGGDLAGFLFPTYSFAAEWLRRGVIPLWNPHLFGGMPFVGDIQSGIFYPPNLLTFFLSNPLTYRDLELLAVFHYLIAGVGMYALLRFGNLATDERGLSRAASFAGALAFEFSDLFITHFGNLNLIAAASWLPLAFLFFIRALEARLTEFRRGFFYLVPSIALAGIFVALAFLAGHIQSFLFVVLALLLYAGWRGIESRAHFLRAAQVFLLTLLIGVGLSALVFLPGLEMTSASVRSTFTYEQAAQFSLPPVELVGLLVPGFFGRGPQAAWGPWSRVEVGYLGVFPLVLAAFAVVLRRDRKTWFFALLALLGLLLALGGYAILHGFAFALAPGFGQLRAPARFIFLLDFGLAVLAAIGFDALLKPLSEPNAVRLRAILNRAPWVFLVVAMLSGGIALTILILGQGQDPVLFARIANAANGIAFFILLLAFSLALLFARAKGSVRAALWSVLALALIFFDLFSLGAYIDLGLGDPTAAYRRDDVISELQSDSGIFRVDSRTDVQGIWLPDTALLYGLYDVNGDNPLLLSDWDHYWESLGGRGSRAYDLLNIKYVLARRSTPLDPKFQRVFDGAGGITVYENRNALPHAWVVYASYLAPNRVRALDQLFSPQFDPRGIVVVEGMEARELADSGVVSDEAQILGYGPNEIDLAAAAKQDGYLVLSEVYFPGWRAFVDEHELPVVRADYLFRAVQLPRGAHKIRFVYDPLSFKIGVVLSALTLLGLMGATIFSARRTSKTNHVDGN